MKFDKTFIAIRERSSLELFDLALHVIADHFRPLFWLLVIGAVPWAVLDYWLVGQFANDYNYQGYYFWLMLLLVVSQAQLGTCFMTKYLGHAMFEGRPRVGTTVREVFKTNLYFLWSHGALRMVVPVILVCLLLSTTDFESVEFISLLYVPALVVLGLFVRAFRPYVSEILLLERTPISKKDPHQIYFSKRSKSFHMAASSDLFGRFIITALFATLMGFSSFALFVTVDSVLNVRANADISYTPFYWIVALWLVAGFVSVVRFLSYIDFRIRQEGWAVELRMRAEGQRLLDAID